jgi:mono/diheme cytochrome c family protein
MKVNWFVIGIVVTLIAISAAAYVYLEKGFVSIRADVKPGALDTWLGSAMDASTSRHAAKVMNPVPDTQDNLLAAAKVYGSRCIVCHGGPTDKNSELGESFSPPAPQFFADEPPNMMEHENFYIIQHGVRMTAMPAWGKLLSEQQIWQLVDLLKHINDKKIPPDVAQELNHKQPGQQ